jgi:hypothetical protein
MKEKKKKKIKKPLHENKLIVVEVVGNSILTKKVKLTSHFNQFLNIIEL